VGNTRQRGRGQQGGEGQDESCRKKTRFHRMGSWRRRG
jgi:hypothetical protein